MNLGSSRLSRVFSSWGTPALLAFLPLVWLWKLAFAGQVLYWGVPLQQFYAWRHLVVQGWLAGVPPLWNPWLGGGTPLLANHQSTPLYPLNLLFFFFPIEQALGYSVLLHLSLAGVGMYVYGRQLRLSREASVLGALAFAFGGYVVARVNFLTMVCTVAWVPLVMWAGDLLACKPGLRQVLVLALVLALQFLAGHTQLVYYTLWLLGGYILCRAWVFQSASKERWWGLLRAGLGLGAALILAALLSAAQMLPTAELALESQRQAGAEYAFAMTYSFWPWRLITLAVPDFFGNPGHGDYWGYANYWEDAAYAGLLPLFLAFYAGWRWMRKGGEGKRGVVPFFLAVIPISILLALGKNLPLYPLVFRWVPGFGFFQAPARLLCGYAFAVAVLAGVGWDLLRPSERLGRGARLLCVATVGGMLAAAAAEVALPQVRQTFSRALLQAGVLGVGVCLLLNWRVRLGSDNSQGWRLWRVAALGWVALDLFGFAQPLIPTANPSLYHRPTETGQFLSQDSEPFRIYTSAASEYAIRYEKYLRFRDFGPSDADSLMGLRETLIPNLSVLDGVAHAGNFDPLLVGRYERFMKKVAELPLEGGLRLLGLLNVRYVLEPGPLGDLEPIYTSPDIRVYRNPCALPMAWVVPRARVVADPEALLEVLAEPSFDPRAEVLLESPTPLQPEGAIAAGLAPKAPVLHLRPNGVTIDVALAEPGYLCVSQTFYPGWQARVDGQPASLVRGNYLLQVVPLAAGPHQVELTYRPVAFWAGASISLVAWVGCLSGLAFGWWGRRRPEGENLRAAGCGGGMHHGKKKEEERL
ncbi:MAG: YfhO family protein [Anaerolineae bacterium]